MHYLKSIFVTSFLMLSMLTSAWAKLEMCDMNNANIEATANMALDCHMDDQTMPNNTKHHCDSCHHCMPVIHHQDIGTVTSLYPAQDYTDYQQHYTPPAMFFDTPPPRHT